MKELETMSQEGFDKPGQGREDLESAHWKGWCVGEGLVLFCVA